MEKIALKKRNLFVDIMRGIVILLVVLGHTMTGCTANTQESIIFNIVWSLQMPLFVLISGYVTKYSESMFLRSQRFLCLQVYTDIYLQHIILH